jgi:hypothetical protein
MNSGLRDAHNLSWKLPLVLQGLASPSLLDTYNEERREHSAQMINVSRFVGNVVMPTAKRVAFFRDAIFLALNTIPAARQYFTEMRIKPQPRYKKGFFLSGADKSAVGTINRPLRSRADKSAPAGLPHYFVTSHYRSLAGLMLPQPEVTTLQGEKVLLDEVLGSGFALLYYSDKPGVLHPSARNPRVGHLRMGHPMAEHPRVGASPAPPIYGHRSMVGAPLAGALPTDAVDADDLDAVREPDIWAQLGVRLICVLPMRPTESESIALPPVSIPITIIHSNEISAFLRHDPDLLVLVRPDRYIFGAFRWEHEAAIASIFQMKLQS